MLVGFACAGFVAFFVATLKALGTHARTAKSALLTVI
jgi:hypothetical protein